ncbi:hypothetical protein NM688_g1368 [Phlebia brevispora]|uniref:Uncharacterized protein n=1 Tax=Phlebia brevispora TaxID=194682 RepID=A0ACC1TBV8_9APHY|nr:hypothetical protein NM688_g1368 [Phlebia brevispora]
MLLQRPGINEPAIPDPSWFRDAVTVIKSTLTAAKTPCRSQSLIARWEEQLDKLRELTMGRGYLDVLPWLANSAEDES